MRWVEWCVRLSVRSPQLLGCSLNNPYVVTVGDSIPRASAFTLDVFLSGNAVIVPRARTAFQRWLSTLHPASAAMLDTSPWPDVVNSFARESGFAVAYPGLPSHESIATQWFADGRHAAVLTRRSPPSRALALPHCVMFSAAARAQRQRARLSGLWLGHSDAGDGDVEDALLSSAVDVAAVAQASHEHGITAPDLPDVTDASEVAGGGGSGGGGGGGRGGGDGGDVGSGDGEGGGDAGEGDIGHSGSTFIGDGGSRESAAARGSAAHPSSRALSPATSSSSSAARSTASSVPGDAVSAPKELMLYSPNVLLPHDHVGAFSRLTVVIMSYKRLDTLMGTVRHYLSLSCLREIVVVWNNPDAAPPFLHAWGHELVPADTVAAEDVQVRMLPQRNNSLNNRFVPVPGLLTVALLSLDDDVRIHLPTVARAFRVWRRFPDRVVGFDFSARGVRANDTACVGCWDYIASLSHCDVLKAPATLALTGASIVHSGWLHAYSRPPPPHRRAIDAARFAVDRGTNGEDLLFAFMAAAYSGLGPVVVMDADYDVAVMKGVAGIHHRVGHFATRASFLSLLVDLFGGMPLQRHAVCDGVDGGAAGVTAVALEGYLVDPAPMPPHSQRCMNDMRRLSARFRHGDVGVRAVALAAAVALVAAVVVAWRGQVPHAVCRRLTGKDE